MRGLAAILLGKISFEFYALALDLYLIFLLELYVQICMLPILGLLSICTTLKDPWQLHFPLTSSNTRFPERYTKEVLCYVFYFEVDFETTFLTQIVQ